MGEYDQAGEGAGVASAATYEVEAGRSALGYTFRLVNATRGCARLTVATSTYLSRSKAWRHLGELVDNFPETFTLVPGGAGGTVRGTEADHG